MKNHFLSFGHNCLSILLYLWVIKITTSISEWKPHRSLFSMWIWKTAVKMKTKNCNEIKSNKKSKRYKMIVSNYQVVKAASDHLFRKAQHEEGEGKSESRRLLVTLNIVKLPWLTLLKLFCIGGKKALQNIWKHIWSKIYNKSDPAMERKVPADGPESPAKMAGFCKCSASWIAALIELLYSSAIIELQRGSLTGAGLLCNMLLKQ